MTEDKRINQQSEQIFVFCPGNGTRYKLVAARIEPDHRGPYDLFVGWLEREDMGGCCTLMSTQHEMDHTYFMEKTGLKRIPDAVAIMCFMREQFGAKIVLPHGYRNAEWVLDGRKKHL